MFHLNYKLISAEPKSFLRNEKILMNVFVRKHKQTNKCLAACCWKANTQETSFGWRRKVALFRELTAWESSGLMFKPFPKFWAKQKSFKVRKGKEDSRELREESFFSQR